MRRPRAREFGVVIGTMQPGKHNAITDVPGVMVGHCTINTGAGPLVVGKGPVRTGVTAILPHPGNAFREKTKAAVHVINGFGKSAGLSQIEELGTLETPIVLTNSLSVGAALDGLVQYMLAQNPEIGVDTGSVNALVGECNDSYLNDIRGRHVRAEHVFSALANAHGGEVEEGAVGAGTGMSCFGFKGGIGSASRLVPCAEERFLLGALVLANFGSMRHLTIAGKPVGQALAAQRKNVQSADKGSIIMVVATDAPLDARQLKRLAKRAAFGLGRTGSFAANGSGDYVFAFSTKNREDHFASPNSRRHETLMRDDDPALAGLFQASAEAIEEAIINALFAAETTTGRDDNVRYALPLDELSVLLAEHGRLSNINGTV